jgi:hypothetical protein
MSGLAIRRQKFLQKNPGLVTSARMGKNIDSGKILLNLQKC